ncbi:MAG: hypothetical protein KF832_31510 [Caldilineaceae bacterium]|nr:hypothetical protein [Caldilineaceae bacterium]
MKNILYQWSISLIIIALLTSCSLQNQQVFCDPPDAIEHSDIIGEWSLLYSNHYVSDPITDTSSSTTYPLNGQEFLSFLANGTYQHEFTAEDYTYKSFSQKWEIDNQALDGPKLKLAEYIYFAAGVPQALSPNTIALAPQMPEQLKIQEQQGIIQGSDLITYPTDGYVYLYPRYCSGQLVLQQMVVGPQDPDDMSIQNPVFIQK